MSRDVSLKGRERKNVRDPTSGISSWTRSEIQKGEKGRVNPLLRVT